MCSFYFKSVNLPLWVFQVVVAGKKNAKNICNSHPPHQPSRLSLRQSRGPYGWFHLSNSCASMLIHLLEVIAK